MGDTLKLVQEALRLAQEAQKPHGLSDTVWIAIVTGVVALATIIINGRIDAKAKKAETLAEAEAAKVTQKLEQVELKIDGRLTELLRLTKAEAEERGQRMGKEQQKSEEGSKVQEAPSAKLPSTGPVKLTITEGEIKVVPETTKKKK